MPITPDAPRPQPTPEVTGLKLLHEQPKEPIVPSEAEQQKSQARKGLAQSIRSFFGRGAL